MLELVLLGLSAIVSLMVALVTLLKNPLAALNRYFFLFVCTFVGWTAVNYISLHPFLVSQLIWIRLVLTMASLMSIFLILMINSFPNGKTYFKRLNKIAVIYGSIAAAVTLTPLVFSGLVYSADGRAQPQVGPGMAIFAPFAIGSIVAGLLTLIAKYRHFKGRTREQIKVAFFGIATTFFLIIISNFILVAFLSNQSLISLAPVYGIIMISSFAYGILHYRLFDIRLIIARFFAYVLLLLFISVVYGGTIAAVSLLTVNVRPSLASVTTSTIVAIVLILVAQPLKRFFDKVTTRLFYQDAYNSQEVIDEVGSVLVRLTSVNELTKYSTSIIGRAIRSEFIGIALVRPSTKQLLGISEKRADLVLQALPTIEKTHMHFIAVDEIEDQSSTLYEELRKAQIATVVRLETSQSIIGYLILGDKVSGRIYTDQDVHLVRLLASELAVALQNALSFEKIENFNRTLQAKIEEATRKLRATNDKLRRLDETKDDFISMASHQLRTPLTSVKGYVSMVLDGDAGKITELQRKLLNQSFLSSQRMVYLISDLLNVSRLKTGKFIIEPMPTDLSKVISEEVEQLVETVKSRDLQLTYHKPEHFPTLMLDETKLRQVIMNFIDNAVYYTPSGGHIDVYLTETPQAIEFTVVDDGIGVPKHEQHHLFGKFYRAHNAKRARPDGTGLGLFMARKVIVAQGGAIIFKSQEGHGSTFGFTFAKNKLAPVPANGETAEKSSTTTK